MQHTDISHKLQHLAILVLTSLALSGCLSQEKDEAGFNGGGNPPSGNNAPVISGSPAGAVVVGNEYSFTPNASDADRSATAT
jgi:hypothetical protein